MSAILLSVDLEDVRDWVEDGSRYSEGVVDNTRQYLIRFRQWGVKATFFVVGRVARRYPELIGEIVEAVHELACHGDMHVQLDKLSPHAFRIDTEKNLASLKEAGGKYIRGFRVPTFSLTKKTAWAHEILADIGLTYSSSVLPAKNPLYGWPAFGQDLGGKIHLNLLMYIGRAKDLRRLDILHRVFQFQTYGEYVNSLEAGSF